MPQTRLSAPLPRGRAVPKGGRNAHGAPDRCRTPKAYNFDQPNSSFTQQAGQARGFHIGPPRAAWKRCVMAQNDKKDGKQQGSSSGKGSQQQQDGGKSKSGADKQSGSKDQGKQRS